NVADASKSSYRLRRSSSKARVGMSPTMPATAEKPPKKLRKKPTLRLQHQTIRSPTRRVRLRRKPKRAPRLRKLPKKLPPQKSPKVIEARPPARTKMYHQSNSRRTVLPHRRRQLQFATAFVLLMIAVSALVMGQAGRKPGASTE